jgi:rhodanese-related sulfurtransferase
MFAPQHLTKRNNQIMTMNAIHTPSYEELYSEIFQQRLSDQLGAILLDVRTSDEFNSGKIPGAININVMENSFLEAISKLDKTKSYFIYCLSGGRSGRACAIMANQGFDVYNLVGGIGSWQGQIAY